MRILVAQSLQKIVPRDKATFQHLSHSLKENFLIDKSSAARPAFLSSPDKTHFIDGKWRPSVSEHRIETFNPATGKVLATLARGQQADVDAAVAAARRAFEGPWSRFTPHQRYALMLRICEML